MTSRSKAIEKIAHYLVANEQTSARKVAAEIVTLYEQTVGLKPDVSTLLFQGKHFKAERYITQWQLVDPSVLDQQIVE